MSKFEDATYYIRCKVHPLKNKTFNRLTSIIYLEYNPYTDGLSRSYGGIERFRRAIFLNLKDYYGN